MGELSLVLFTVISQLAVGAFVTLWMLEALGKKISIETGKMLTISILGITAIGLVISLTHLGHPFKAYMALTNVGNSWLSREVIMFSLFFAAILIYFLQWKDGMQNTRKLIGLVGAIIGTVGVIFSGMIYVLPAMPAWNNFSPVIFFLITALLLGPVYVSSVLVWRKEMQLPNIAVLALVAIIISILASLLHLSTISSGSIAQSMTATNMLASSVFWLRIVIGWVIPLAIFAHYAYHKQQMNASILVTAFVMLLAGEFMARELFYSTVVALQIGL